jgi:triacylglycerol lipase
MEDEGTLFALFQSNLTTKEDIVEYLDQRYFLHAGREEIARLVDLYDDIEENGSPFRTGLENNWYPQFKRLSAILGDLVFTITRRLTLHVAVEFGWTAPFWSYMNSYYYGLPILGSTHGLDLIAVYYGLAPGYATRAWRQYYINFVNNLDPNDGGVYGDVSYWPEWKEDQTIIQMHPDRSEVIKDNFRQPVSSLLPSLGSLSLTQRRFLTICLIMLIASTSELEVVDGVEH